VLATRRLCGRWSDSPVAGLNSAAPPLTYATANGVRRNDAASNRHGRGGREHR
jgi:hypothetical protein